MYGHYLSFYLTYHRVTDSVDMVTSGKLIFTILMSRTLIHNFKLISYTVTNTVYRVTLLNTMATI